MHSGVHLFTYLYANAPYHTEWFWWSSEEVGTYFLTPFIPAAKSNARIAVLWYEE